MFSISISDISMGKIWTFHIYIEMSQIANNDVSIECWDVALNCKLRRTATSYSSKYMFFGPNVQDNMLRNAYY